MSVDAGQTGPDALLAEVRAALLETEHAADDGARSRAGLKLCAAFRVLDETLSARGELPDAWRGTEWTVLGVWRGSDPVPVGVIRGCHQVDGGDWGGFPEGLWATAVGADDVAGAQAAAIEEMRFWDS